MTITIMLAATHHHNAGRHTDKRDGVEFTNGCGFLGRLKKKPGRWMPGLLTLFHKEREAMVQGEPITTA